MSPTLRGRDIREQEKAREEQIRSWYEVGRRKRGDEQKTEVSNRRKVSKAH